MASAAANECNIVVVSLKNVSIVNRFAQIVRAVAFTTQSQCQTRIEEMQPAPHRVTFTWNGIRNRLSHNLLFFCMLRESAGKLEMHFTHNNSKCTVRLFRNYEHTIPVVLIIIKI